MVNSRREEMMSRCSIQIQTNKPPHHVSGHGGTFTFRGLLREIGKKHILHNISYSCQFGIWITSVWIAFHHLQKVRTWAMAAELSMVAVQVLPT